MRPTQRETLDRTILDLLGEIEKLRGLNSDERKLMDRIFNRTRKRSIWRWSAKDDRKLQAVMRARAQVGRPKPFERNDEIRNLALEMGRTYFAVHRRMERLRKQEKCSNAADKAKRV